MDDIGQRAGAMSGQNVAQVSNLLYHSASSLRAQQIQARPLTFGRAADWKSATQQVGNLRYDFVSGPEKRTKVPGN